MSLYSDLNEVLTPYAQRIKNLKADIDDQVADLSNLVHLESHNSFNPTWSMGYVAETGSISRPSSNSAVSTFILVDTETITIKIKDGYKARVCEYTAPVAKTANLIKRGEYIEGKATISVHNTNCCMFVLMLKSEESITIDSIPDDVVSVLKFRKSISNYPFIRELNRADGDSSYFYIMSGNKWVKVTKKASIIFPISAGYYRITANDNYDTIWALLDANFREPAPSEVPDFVQYSGRQIIPKGSTEDIYVEQESALYVYYKTLSGDIYFPLTISAFTATDGGGNVIGAPIDSTIVRNTLNPVLSTIETINNAYRDSDTKYGVGLIQGSVTTDATAKTTDFIAIPKKYNKNLLYTHLLVDCEYGGSISFYDASKNYISTIQVTSYVQNITDSEYIKCTTPIDAGVTLTFSNETATPQAREQLAFNNGRQNWFSQRMVSDGCMTSMIKTALAYTGSNEYGYGTEHTAFGEECIKTTKDVNTSSSRYDDERYQIDCSTYVMLIIMGIKPQCSRYHYTKNIPAPYGYVFNTLANYEGYVYNVPQTGDTKRLYANSIADYANRNGYLYSVNDDFSNVQPGDILFLSNQSASYNFFKDIGHCMFVYNVIDMENGKAVETLEANGGTGNPCNRRLYLEKPDKMLYGAKLPYNYVSDNAENIANFSNEVSIVNGGTVDIQLNKPIRKGNVYTVVACADDIMSGHIELSVDGLSYAGYATDDMIHRPDGIIVTRFTVPMNYVADATEITLTYVGNDGITLNNVSVYDGYVTESVI